MPPKRKPRKSSKVETKTPPLIFDETSNWQDRVKIAAGFFSSFFSTDEPFSGWEDAFGEQFSENLAQLRTENPHPNFLLFVDILVSDVEVASKALQEDSILATKRESFETVRYSFSRPLTLHPYQGLAKFG